MKPEFHQLYSPNNFNRFILFLAVLCLSLSARVVQASRCEYPLPAEQASPSDEDWLVLVLKAKTNVLSSTLEAYQVNGTLFLPVDSLSHLFKLTVSGDKDTLIVDLPQNQCPATIPKTVLSDGFTQYLSLADWQSLLTSRLAFNYNKLLLTFNSELEYFQEFMKRDSSTQSYSRYQFDPDISFSDDYEIFTPPSFYLAVNSDWSESRGKRQRINSTGVSDLMYHSMEWNVFDSTGNKDSQRLKFSRFSESDRELPLGLAEYSFGDINSYSDNLVHSSAAGLGVKFSSSDQTSGSRFRSLAIDLNLPADFRAELFRNDLLLSSTSTNEEGRLVFDDVDVLVGMNEFTIKLYDPLGDIQEITKQVYVDGSSLPRGQLDYEGFVINSGERLIDDGLDTNSDLEGKLNVVYGLSDQTTLGVGMHQLSLGGTDSSEQRRYLSGRLISNFKSIGYEAEAVVDNKNNQAALLGLSGKINDVRINTNLSWYDSNFESELHSSDNPKRFELTSLISGNSEWLNGMKWRVNGRYSERYSGDDSLTLNGTLYRPIRGGSIQGSLIYNSNLGIDSLASDIYATQLIGRNQFSARLRLDPLNDWRLDSFQGEARWRSSSSKFFMNSRINYLPDRENEWALTHGVNWRHKLFNLNASVSYSHDDEIMASVGISTALDFSPLNNQFIFSNLASRSSSRIHARAFLDHNRNEIFDEGDEGVKNVAFRGNRRWNDFKTDESGDVLLVGAVSRSGQQVEVDLASIEDPYLQPVRENALIETHPGGVALFEVPLQIMNEIEGSVYFTHNGLSKAKSDVPLFLVNDEQQIVATTKTEMDGYYLFTKLAPGRYRVTIDPDYIADNELQVKIKGEPVVANPEGGAQWLPDLVMERLRLAEPLMASSRESHWMNSKMPLVYPHNESDYYIQLGMYNNIPDMNFIRKGLPNDDYELHVFRNHQSGQSYTVAGPYASLDTAHRGKQDVLDFLDSTNAAFVVKGTKFSDSGFAQELVPKNLLSRIRLSHRRIIQAPDNTVVCQLGTYKKISPLSLSLLEQYDHLSVVQRDVKGELLYTIFGGPFLETKEQACSQPMTEGGAESWARSAVDLLHGLAALTQEP